MSIVPRSTSAPASAAPAFVGAVDYTLHVSSAQEQSFVALYEWLFPRLCTFAERFLSRPDAMDVVHDTMAEVWSRWPVLSIEGRDVAFYFRAVRNRIANHRRREHREHRRLAQYLSEFGRRTRKTSAPDYPLEQAELAAVIETAVAALPERSREAWLLVRENALTYQQAADAMDVATKTAKNHMTVAQNRLREAITDAGYHEAARAPRQIPSMTQEQTND